MNNNHPSRTISNPSLADLIAFIETDAKLTKTRRRDMVSAARTTARLLNRQPDDIPANTAALRERFKQIHPKQVRITAKRLANIKSELAAALKRYKKLNPAQTPSQPLSPAWVNLKSSIDEQWQRCRVSRFTRFCSERGIEPEHVNDDTLIAFRDALGDHCLAKDPQRVYKQTIQTWNRLAASLPGWPSVRLTAPKNEKNWTRPISDFPISFRRDVARWLMRLKDVDLLAEDAPSRPLRPASLKNIRVNIRQFASALIERGHPIENITRLAYLVEVDNFKDGLRFFIDRNGGQSPSWLKVTASSILAIAKYHVRVDPTELQKLKNITARLGSPNRGLTEKNRRRLRKFDDSRNVSLLLNLPLRLVDRANKRADVSSWVALEVQIAIAIEILLMAPMRIANVAALRLDHHITWQGSGRNRVAKLAIPGAEVENGQPIEFQLPPESSALLETYLTKYRRVTSDNPNEWLFPSRSGTQKRSGYLGRQISERIHKETGLEVNPHLFRHLGAQLYLTDNPGGYEVVRRVLTHRSSDTTLNFYTGIETKSATAHFDKTILSHRQRLPNSDNGGRPMA